MNTLKQLLTGLEYEGSPEDRDVADVVIDSRKVRRGSVFVALRGASFDGHDRAAEALQKGAAAVVTERKLGLLNEVVVEDARIANALLCAAFFSRPADRLKLIGITGTNGKTTVASLIKQALTALGCRAGLIGTIQNEIGEMCLPAKFTTPEPWDLHALLGAMRGAGCEYAVMEASSQALAQRRLYGLKFETAVFTNLSQDHLDYHGTMERYFEAKKKLFHTAGRAVVNLDGDYGKTLRDELEIPVITYSEQSNEADYTAKSIEGSASGVRFAVSGNGFIRRVALPIPGRHTVSNALAAVAALTASGISPEEACDAVSSVTGVCGRSEVLYNKDVTVIRDFAHTADAFRQLLSGLRPSVSGRMVVLFGCTGDRDALKRPDMVGAVTEYADFVALSSDNPRTEDPEKILEEVSELLKASGKPFFADPDREAAIRRALEYLQPGDLLLLCGKGHEDYQVLDGVTVRLDERSIVEEYFGEGGGGAAQKRGIL